MNLNIITLSYFFIILLFCIIIIRSLYYTYKKLFKTITAADVYFSENKWNNYMFGVFKYNYNDDEESFDIFIDKFINRLKSWETSTNWYKKFNIRGIIEINETDTQKSLIEKLDNSEPEYVNNKLLPFKVVFLKKENIVITLLNHYYCDGIILNDFHIHVLYNIEKKCLNVFDYNYIPILHDYFLLSYGFRCIYNSYFSNYKHLQRDSNKTSIITKSIPYDGYFNRYKCMAITIEFLFSCVKKDELSIAFTVGFNDDNTINNRIGAIILNVLRQKNCEDYEYYLKCNLIKYKDDSISSYDLARNFPIYYIRNSVMNNSIDVILTSFLIDGECEYKNNLKYVLGTFIGRSKTEAPIYILSTTDKHQKKLQITLRNNSSELDIPNILENDKDVKLYCEHK